jgi:DNA-binding FrmR family transcriptional regulator
VDLSEATVDDLIRRLRKVGGQIRGIEQMVSDKRDCRDVVTQVSAANKALEQVGFLLVSASLQWCVAHPEASAAEGYELAEVERMFLKLA